MSEQLHTNSSFFKPVPMKPSSRFIYNFSFASATFAASILSKLRTIVRRGWAAPYFFFRFSYHLIAYSTRCSRFSLIAEILSLSDAIYSSALSLLNFKIRPIFISKRRMMSSRLTSRTNEALNGSNRLSI